ncbi:Endogenous retrovirus group K member 8 Pol protein [Lonchura striata]|uniref:Endogenous retrovirus group K member 8 Pol protein n=1 Tax=Lonchura striata TaxID=40157 RepID=A0A218VD77_9PASE|nr:Endogenous retrovirus group K member 8 Pol protein [Lonchura striata domestica]
MGPLQPGLPSPSMLPRDWQLAVIDIKDCFFNILLFPRDAPRFAFSVPSINRAEPYKRYQWTTLPQGMKNSPVLCQIFVAQVLSPVRKIFPEAIILHYMDDVLICAKTETYLKTTLAKTIAAIEAAGFEIAKDKIQLAAPWKYLGFFIAGRTIVPQSLTINDKPRTLRDLQQICGTITWIRPLLGLTTEELAPLFNLLRGDGDLASPRELTPAAKGALESVADAVRSRQAHRVDRSLPLELAILGKCPNFHGLLFQWDAGQRDPLLVIEWLFLPHQPVKTISTPVELMAKIIIKARQRLRTLAGCDPACIYMPLNLEQLESLLQTNENLQIALDSYPGQISIHYPKHKLFKDTLYLAPKSFKSKTPIKGALTVFTDGSGKSHKSVITWKDPDSQKWESDIQIVEGSPQIAELAAVVRAFKKFQQPLNLVTDSAYVAGIVERAEHALLKDISNKKLFHLLLDLIWLISHREQLYHVMHVRAHTDLPGSVAEGNRRADQLAMPLTFTAPALSTNLPDTFAQARLSHAFFHQNAPALARQFKISHAQARSIVTTCSSCQTFALPSMAMGVNPRGLGALELWQTDITHYSPFGRLKYMHVSVDTFSGAVFASLHTGEKTKDSIKHLYMAFATLGVPKAIKTDNGPGFTSARFKQFLQQWGIAHTTGIPHNPTGQAIIERTHKNIKQLLEQQQDLALAMTPVEKVCKALYVLNFLNCSEKEPNPPVLRHFYNNTRAQLKERPPVLVRDPESKQVSGPYPLITWGRGSLEMAAQKTFTNDLREWTPRRIRLAASLTLLAIMAIPETSTDREKKSSSVKYLEVLVDKLLNMSQQCELAAQKTNHILVCIKRGVPSRSAGQEVSLPLSSALMTSHLQFCILESSAQERCLDNEKDESNRDAQR